MGTGKVYGHDQSGESSANETISGTFFGDESVTLTATRDDGVVYTLDNAPFGGPVTNATTNPAVSWDVEMKVSQPAITITEESKTTDTTTTTNYKNHGDYVSKMAAAPQAAHSHREADQSQQVTRPPFTSRRPYPRAFSVSRQESIQPRG